MLETTKFVIKAWGTPSRKGNTAGDHAKAREEVDEDAMTYSKDMGNQDTALDAVKEEEDEGGIELLLLEDMVET